MEGLLFLWFSWMGVIYCFFILERNNPYRDFILIGLLCSIMLSPYEVDIKGTVFNSGGICLCLLALCSLRGLPFTGLVYFTIRTQIISFAYGSISLLFFLDPVWMIWDQTWMLGPFLTYVNILLFSDWKKRISSLIVGLFFGDIILSILFHQLHMPHKMVSASWLDLTSVSVILILAWCLMEKVSKSLHVFFQNKNLLKEKQG